MQALENDLKKICDILNQHGIDYMLIGGFAVSFHGYTRTTSDIDFWFNPTHENYFKLLDVLKELEMDVSELQQEIFNPENTFLRISFQGIKIEFLSSIPGKFNYREASAASVKVQINDLHIKIIGLEHLIENKSVLNRPIDKIDVEELRKRMDSGTGK